MLTICFMAAMYVCQQVPSATIDLAAKTVTAGGVTRTFNRLDYHLTGAVIALDDPLIFNSGFE